MAENVKTVDQKVDELSAVVDRILKYVEDTRQRSKTLAMSQVRVENQTAISSRLPTS